MAEGPGGVRWASPQVLVPALALIAAAGYALRAAPPEVSPPPELTPAAPAETQVGTRDVVLYLVDDELARPQVRALPDPSDASASLQAVVDALREALIEEGAWPEALPAPRAYALELERSPAAVLDLPEHDVALDVAAERRIVASLRRTLLEQGIERLAFLRGGGPVEAWPSQLAVPSSLE
jgi:hypothetical protein